MVFQSQTKKLRNKEVTGKQNCSLQIITMPLRNVKMESASRKKSMRQKMYFLAMKH